VLFTQEELKSFSSQHCPGMYADCKEKLASNVPFTIVIPNLLHMASHNSLGNNSKGVVIGFLKVIHFGYFCKGNGL
jgi:hypothetical protein